jgi:uncharacterized membrane protein
MLSNHYPLAFASAWNWLIASLVFLMGVTIRHYFNSMHAGTGKPHWTWGATVVLFLTIVWLSTVPADRPQEEAALRGEALRFAQAEGFEDVTWIVQGRCSMCHAAEPVWAGLHWAPRGLHLETEAQIAQAARQIYLQAGVSHAMPPANVTWMEPDERAAIVAWFRAAQG